MLALRVQASAVRPTLVVLGLLAFAGRVRAQDSEDRSLTPPPPAKEKPARGLPQGDPTCIDATMLGGTDDERAAVCALRRGEYVSARTFVEKALRADDESVRAHFLMGAVQHLGEGNLPKALFHLETAEKLFIDAHGERPVRDQAPIEVYRRTLLELVYVHGEMDHHEEKIRYVDALRLRLDLDFSPLKAWPLMKLKRFDEARRIAKQAIAKDHHWYQAVGLTALCAVESEQRRRYKAYEACVDAVRPVRNDPSQGAIELSNAAAASEEVFRFDEAERMYLESASRPPEGSVNPWGRLVRLYVRQGRFAEAVGAWRKMRAYRASRPGAYLDQQDQSEADLLGVEIMLMAGRAEEAERVTGRTVQRPDRQGTSSADSAQNEIGAAIIDRVSKLTAARLLEEEASISPWWPAMKLRARALRLRFGAWSVGRRGSELLSDQERLIASLRPECPGSVEGPAWLDVEAVDLVGPGVALAALERARAIEVLPPEQSEMIFGVHEAEAHWRAGSLGEALSVAERTLERLPQFEVMLRARVAAIAADAATRLDRPDDAQRWYRLVLMTDPGILRRLGLELPVRLIRVGGTPEVMAAETMLAGSPRLRLSPAGFRLEISEQGVRLFDANGGELAGARVRAGRPEALAERIARTVHRDLLVPDVDLTQADIRSLDGSLNSGGKASDFLDGVMEEVIDPQ